MKVQGKSVLILPDEAPKFTKTGIKIPDPSKVKVRTGKIIDAGPACKEVCKGDRVYYNTSAASIIDIDGVDHHFVIEDEIQFKYE